MIRSVWIKSVVASLIILGEGAFAFENAQRSDDSYEANGNAVQLSQPIVQEDGAPGWTSSLTSPCTIHPDINLEYQIFTAVTVTVSALLRYHPFNPRAPPVPAS